MAHNLKEFKTTQNKVNDSQYYKPKIIETGDISWDYENGVKRQRIIEEVGLEHNQINLLAAILLEILKSNPELFSNPIIQSAISKFNTINEIRKS